jgi:AcrR family transcriptional regulator
MDANRAPTRISGAQRRERILDAAAEGFAARGFHATSIGEIAAAAGITKPVVYDHFPSKRELFVELMEGARDELTSRGAEIMARDAPPEERVRAAIDAFFGYVEEHPAAARVLFTAPKGEPDLFEAARAVQAEAAARIAALFAAEPDLLPGVPDRERWIELSVEFLKQGMHGLAEWWGDHPRVPRGELVDAVMDLVWVGLRAQFSSPPPG